MDYFYKSNLMYIFRRIIKQLGFSALFIAFVIICLLLMVNNVHAAALEVGTYNMIRDDENYFDWFDVTYTIGSDGSISFQGLMGKRSYHNECTLNGSFVNFKYWDNDYFYIPVISHHYSTATSWIYKVPKNSTFYCYNAKTFNTEYNNAFYCNQAYTRYQNDNFNTATNFSAGSVDIINDYTTYGLCTTYTDSSLTTQLYPPPPVFAAPSFLNYDDRTTYGNTLETGEIDYFYIDANTTNNILVQIFNDTALSSDNNNYSEFFLGVGSLFQYYIDENTVKYAIPTTAAFGAYLNDCDYRLVISYRDAYDIGQTLEYTWTTDFSTAGQTRQTQLQQNMMLANIGNMNNFFANTDLSEQQQNDILSSMPSSIFNNSPVLSGFDALFNALQVAITGLEHKELTFVIPHTTEYITIESTMLLEKLPTQFIAIIRTFYWFMIARYILLSIAHLFELLATGDLLESSKFDVSNIKTSSL